jgi:hypothetical protein
MKRNGQMNPTSRSALYKHWQNITQDAYHRTKLQKLNLKSRNTSPTPEKTHQTPSRGSILDLKIFKNEENS